jgi:hypothetical protein
MIVEKDHMYVYQKKRETLIMRDILHSFDERYKKKRERSLYDLTK